MIKDRSALFARLYCINTRVTWTKRKPTECISWEVTWTHGNQPITFEMGQRVNSHHCVKDRPGWAPAWCNCHLSKICPEVVDLILSIDLIMAVSCSWEVTLFVPSLLSCRVLLPFGLCVVCNYCILFPSHSSLIFLGNFATTTQLHSRMFSLLVFHLSSLSRAERQRSEAQGTQRSLGQPNGPQAWWFCTLNLNQWGWIFTESETLHSFKFRCVLQQQVPSRMSRIELGDRRSGWI